MTTDSKELLQKSYFARAPFHVVPVDSKLVWAGSGSVRNELLRIVNEVRHDSLELSHLALIYGEYGSGKTHALKYLRNHLADKGRSLVAYLAKPKVEKKGSFHGIAKEVLKQLGRSPLRNAVEPIVAYIENETAQQVQEAVRNIGGDELRDINSFMKQKTVEARRHIQEGLYPAFPEIFNLFGGLVDDDAEAWNYFAAKPSKDALQRFELNSPIEDDHDALRALAAVYGVLTTRYPEIPGTPIYDASYLFIDEMEQFLETKAEEYLSIRTGLRDLFNSCTEHFCMVLAATAENSSLFHGILEEAIMVRITAEPIHVSSHDEVEDGVKFLTDLMQYARNGHSPPSREHPFTKQALATLVERTTEPRTARKLIQNCNRIWQTCSSVVISGGTISDADASNVHGFM